MDKKFRLLLLFILLITGTLQKVLGQNQDIYLFIDSTTIIGKISDKEVFVSETEVGYIVQGNLIFSGDSTAIGQLLFSVNAKDILSKKVGLVYQNDMSTIQYITQNSAFFLGDYPLDKEHEKLLTIEKINDSVFNVRRGTDATLIGTIEGKFNSQVQIVMAAHLYIKHFELDVAVRRVMRSLEKDTTASGYGYIRPVFDRGPYFEWIWDGETLKPAWGYRPEDEWKFDGKYLKPVWSADPQAEWVWDGSMLKPSWESGVQDQWKWEGSLLKPFWDSNPDLQWTLDGDIVRPMWNFDPLLQWQIEGQVPLPVLTLLIIGKADR